MKVVSLSPSFTEIVFCFRKAAALTAVTDHCPPFERDILRIGSPKALKIDALLEAKPDFVLSEIHENRPEEIAELKKRGVTVHSFDVHSIDHVLDVVAAVARLFDAKEAGEALMQQIKVNRQENVKRFQGKGLLRTLILLWDQPYLTVNFDTYISHLVEACGGFNVFHEEPIPEIPIELEDMMEKNPELLLLPTDPFPFGPRHLNKFKQYRIFSQIPIRLLDGRLFSRFGPATYEALKILGGLIAHANDAHQRIQ